MMLRSKGRGHVFCVNITKALVIKYVTMGRGIGSKIARCPPRALMAAISAIQIFGLTKTYFYLIQGALAIRGESSVRKTYRLPDIRRWSILC